MSQGTFWFALFLLLVLAALGGVFLYGWLRRKNRPPKVAPLPDEEEDDWR